MKKKFLLLSVLSFSLIACTGGGSFDLSSFENITTTQESSSIISSIEPQSSPKTTSTDSSMYSSSIESSTPESSQEIPSPESSSQESSSSTDPVYAPLSSSILKTLSHDKVSLGVTGNMKATIQIKTKLTYSGISTNNTETISLQCQNFTGNCGFDLSDLSNTSSYTMGAEFSGDLYEKVKMATAGITISDDSSTLPISMGAYLENRNAYIALSQSHLSDLASLVTDKELPILSQNSCFEHILPNIDTDIDLNPSLDPTSIDASCDLIDQSISWDSMTQVNGIDTYTKDISKDDLTEFVQPIKDTLALLNINFDDINFTQLILDNIDFSKVDLSKYGLEGIDLSDIDVDITEQEIQDLYDNAILDCTIDFGANDEGIQTLAFDSMIKTSATVKSKINMDGITMDQETKTSITILPDIEFTYSYDDDAVIPTPQDKDTYTVYNLEGFIDDIKEAIKNKEE